MNPTENGVNIMRILVIEDDPDLNLIIQKRLKSEHYSVDSCTSGTEAYHYIKQTNYDVILLDLMIPGMDGLTLLKEIRKSQIKSSILILSAKDNVTDRVTGLDYGADDYLAKPFSFDELLARIRVLIRRNSDKVTNIIHIGDLIIDRSTHCVTRGEKEILLTSKEYAILEYLADHQGIVLSRSKIEEHVWSYDYEGGSNMVDVYIRYLRKKIDEAFNQKLIHTIRGVGYVLKDNN